MRSYPPTGVFTRHAHDEGFDLWLDGRPSRILSVLGAVELFSDELSIPPTSKTVQIFGWFNAEAARAPRWNRANASEFSALARGRNLIDCSRNSV